MNDGSTTQAAQPESAKPAMPGGALLSFTPFVSFALVEKLFGPLAGLAAGALVSIAVVLTVAALLAAFKFTTSFAARRQAAARAAANGSTTA